jgi:hypothetical protein
MIIGPYLAVSAVESNFVPFGVLAAMCAVFVVFGYLRDGMCLLPLIGTFIAGKFNFIPILRPAPTELFPLALVIYYLIAYTALQRKKFLTGPLLFFIPITIIALIMIYHEHTFGLRSEGGGREGGREAIFVVAAAIAYLCGVSVNSPSPRFLYWTPLFCVIAAVVSAIPYAVTTYLPGTTPFFYIFTDNINGTAYSADVLNTGTIVRSGAQSVVGAAVMTFLVSYFPVFTWWRPNRWWVALLSLGCIGLVLIGGFRSIFAEFGFTIFVALWCYYSWRALLVVPIFALGIVLITALHSSHAIQLPLAAQRSLAFLPGDWDPEVLDNTKASNDFRTNILKVYMREDAAKSPLLGNGLSYDSADFQRYSYLAMYQEMPDSYYGTEIFVTGKMFHTGWISLYDAEGVIGFATFLVFTLSLVWFSGRMVFQKGVDRHSMLFPLKVWMFCNLLTNLVSFFTVFGDFKFAFPVYCFYAILWVHLGRLERFGYWANVPVRQVPFDPSRTELSVPAPT